MESLLGELKRKAKESGDIWLINIKKSIQFYNRKYASSTFITYC